MNILIITPDYPTERENNYAFVEQLVNEWARVGHHCTVVSTYSISKHKHFCPFHTSKTIGSGKVDIYRPNTISFSNFQFMGVSPSSVMYRWGMMRAFKAIKTKQDVVYCHFWQSAILGTEYAKLHNIPCYVATGESEIKKLLGNADVSFAKDVKGVICVSSKNRDESIELHLTTKDKCKVLPNAVNSDLFHKMDKGECRRKLGLEKDVFIIAFVGAFIERKGPDRVSAAINQISGKSVYSLFIGTGNVSPTANNILHCGKVMHDDIPTYLNAADVFVLPTLKEGCCNAVVEAMACGLPIVSSNLSFNWDVLDESNSIMIDPMDVDEIKKAIELLRDDESLRARLSDGALEKAKSLTIDQRAKRIIEFIQ